MHSLRLALAAGALVAASAPFATTSAQAATCGPVVEYACWAWGTACQYVPSDGGKYDPHALLCTVVM